MRLIVGLGNPGREYEGSRHNLGFEVVDLLAQRNDIRVCHRLHRALYGRGRVAGTDCLVAKPQTFMNASGEAVARLLFYYRIPLADLIVVCDDLALDLGRLRLRRRGSAGGHKGLASIISHLHSPDFPRLRLGIGAPPPGWDGVDWVLSRFAPQERPLADEAVANAAEAVEFLLREGIEAAMNRYN
jgi:PTH1 family peptidyl-tRNA hydrolase